MSSSNEGVMITGHTLSRFESVVLSIGRGAEDESVLQSLVNGIAELSDAQFVCAFALQGSGLVVDRCTPDEKRGKDFVSVLATATQELLNMTIDRAGAKGLMLSVSFPAVSNQKNAEEMSRAALGATVRLPEADVIKGRGIAIIPGIDRASMAPLINILIAHADVKLRLLAAHRATLVEARKRATADLDLRASQHALEEAQRISQTGSWSWNSHTNAVTGSAEFLRVYELSPGEDFSYEVLARRIHHDDYAAFEQALLQAAANREVFKHQYRIVKSDGTIRHLNAEGHPSFDVSGNFVLSGVVSDVTEYRQAAEALQAAQMQLARSLRFATMGQLAASIVHEINQPLTAVVTNSETCLRWLTKATPDVHQAQLAAARTTRDAERAAKVLISLRSLAWRTGFVKSAVDINDAIREVALMLRSELERERVSLRLSLEQTCAVQGDRVQLQQVLLNLMRNSIEAMGESPGPRNLSVATCGIGTRVRVEVSDNGPGLDPEIADSIFDPMYTTKMDGMGMGLSICKAIVEAHEGKLTFASMGGQGTSFEFSISCFDPAVQRMSE
jgi:signal transduction histidine kinase